MHATRIFISKAVILLCAAKKCRDADHLQNLVYDEMRGVDPDTLADELRNVPEYVPIPEYAFDCHTRRGKAAGKTNGDFFYAECSALFPMQQGILGSLVDG